MEPVLPSTDSGIQDKATRTAKVQCFIISTSPGKRCDTAPRRTQCAPRQNRFSVRVDRSEKLHDAQLPHVDLVLLVFSSRVPPRLCSALPHALGRAFPNFAFASVLSHVCGLMGHCLEPDRDQRVGMARVHELQFIGHVQ